MPVSVLTIVESFSFFVSDVASLGTRNRSLPEPSRENENDYENENDFQSCRGRNLMVGRACAIVAAGRCPPNAMAGVTSERGPSSVPGLSTALQPTSALSP